VELLNTHGITAVCDVRSQPYSRYAPQFNREPLKEELTRRHIAYIHLGDALGPRSTDPTCYKNGKIQYDRVAKGEIFAQGIERLRKGSAIQRIALMCAEKDPLTCHRMILICRHLRGDDIKIRHILWDGMIEDNEETEKRLMGLLGVDEEDLLNSREDQINLAYDIQGKRIAYELKGQGEKK
ncbi:MAG: DUF488 domain-containing protein, partial [Syntrophales bacterium]|nr:DUF488 domain-containing protein [Syntrophales bacterium]